MSALKSYRELIVWQKSMDLVTEIYKNTSNFPKEEIYGLTSQMRRAAVSIPSNVSEGQARNSTGEFKQFLGISKGSLAELETQIQVSLNLNFLTKEAGNQLQLKCYEINKLIHGLIKSLQATNN